MTPWQEFQKIPGMDKRTTMLKIFRGLLNSNLSLPVKKSEIAKVVGVTDNRVEHHVRWLMRYRIITVEKRGSDNYFTILPTSEWITNRNDLYKRTIKTVEELKKAEEYQRTEQALLKKLWTADYLKIRAANEEYEKANGIKEWRKEELK